MFVANLPAVSDDLEAASTSRLHDADYACDRYPFAANDASWPSCEAAQKSQTKKPTASDIRPLRTTLIQEPTGQSPSGYGQRHFWHP